jgi:hypothetical protein
VGGLLLRARLLLPEGTVVRGSSGAARRAPRSSERLRRRADGRPARDPCSFHRRARTRTRLASTELTIVRHRSAQAAVALRCARARRVEGHIGTHAGEAAKTEALDTRRDQQRRRKPVAADITLSFA